MKHKKNQLSKSSKKIKGGKVKDKEYQPVKQKLFKTGVPGFDRLLKSGGIPESRSVLVEGGPGSGKTIFCMQMAMNFCARGKRALYMSFEEPEENLISHMENFGFRPRKYVKEGLLTIRRFNALDIARSVEALLSEAKKELLIEVQPILIPQDSKPDVVFVDSLTSIASAFSGEQSRFRIYMEQLFRYLESHQMTSFLIREVSNPGHIGTSGLDVADATSFLSDGIIIFYNVVFEHGKRTRAIEILKLRGVDFDRCIYETEIFDKKGVIVSKKQLKGKYRLT